MKRWCFSTYYISIIIFILIHAVIIKIKRKQILFEIIKFYAKFLYLLYLDNDPYKNDLDKHNCISMEMDDYQKYKMDYLNNQMQPQDGMNNKMPQNIFCHSPLLLKLFLLRKVCLKCERQVPRGFPLSYFRRRNRSHYFPDWPS